MPKETAANGVNLDASAAQLCSAATSALARQLDPAAIEMVTDRDER